MSDDAAKVIEGHEMAYILFNYEPGSVEARFGHDTEFDFINLDIRMAGDITTTTECDDQGHKAEPVEHQKENTNFAIYMSSVYCPFKDFIRFLEAITLEVRECAFDWEAEGPDGRIHWKRRFIHDTGFLTVEWYSSKERFSHRVMLNTREAVRVLYSAFRTFIESPDYDPIRYERLTYGESFALVLSNASLDDLAATIVQLNADAARTVIQRLQDTIYERHMSGPKLGFSIQYFLETTEPIASSEYNAWINPDWNSWGIDQRMVNLKELFGWRSECWDGDNLRELRSKRVEDWLAFAEPSQLENESISSEGDRSASK